MGSIDRQFARFRRTGDATALARLFDATAPELLRVALYLSGDRQAAEDLVQGTFVVVIEDAASHDAGRVVMPWLLGILANRARELRKARARTPDPERVAQRLVGLQPRDPADDAAHAEFEAAVARAIEAMPSPYGEVLALHLMHGLTAKDIATALRRPAGTVRTQVVRAMEFLRAALPAGFAPVTLVALAPGKGLDAVREALLAKVAAKQAATAGTMAVVGTIGGLLVMKTLLAAGGVIVLAALAWMAWPGPARPADLRAGRDARTQVTASEGSDPREATAEGGGFDSAASERRTVVLDPASSTGAIHLEVSWQDDGTPAANVPVSYRAQGARGAQVGSACADALGVTIFAALAPGRYLVRAGETSEEDLVVVSGKTTRARLRITPEVVLDGIVVDPGGTPVAGAAVRSTTTAGLSTLDLSTLATSRGDGSFAWRGSDARQIWAEKDGRVPSRMQVVKPDHGKPRTLRLVLGSEAPLLQGLVLDKDGRPAAHARVAISVDEALILPLLPDDRLRRGVPPVVLHADQSGRFATASVPIGDHWVLASAERSAPALQRVTVATDVPEPIVVRLLEGSTLHGVVRDVAGRPLSATVRARGFQPYSMPGLWPAVGAVMDAHAVTRTDADGRYVLANLFPSRLDLEFTAAGMSTLQLRIDLTHERDLEWNPILGPELAIAGRVVDAEGRPLAGWVVNAQADNRASVQGRADAEGAFTLSVLPARPCSVWAVPDTAVGATAGMHWGEARLVLPGTKGMVLRTQWRTDGAAFLTGRVMGTDGGTLTGARIKLEADRGWDEVHESVIDAGDGRFVIGPLPPQEHQIDVSAAGHATLTLRRKLDAGQTLDLGAIRLAPMGTLTVAARRPDGNSPTDLALRIAADDRAFLHAWFSQQGDGTWQSRPWPPGAALLEVWGPDVARIEHAVGVAPGADVRVELTLEPATPVRFLFAQPKPRTAVRTQYVRLTLRDAAGAETSHLFQLPFQPDGGETLAWTRGLASGHYDFEAELIVEPQPKTADGHFVVPAHADGTQAPVDVRVTFPDRRPVPHADGPGPGRGRRG